jgi:hypothetical protein
MPEDFREAARKHFGTSHEPLSVESVAARYRERKRAAVVFTVDHELVTGPASIANREIARKASVTGRSACWVRCPQRARKAGTRPGTLPLCKEGRCAPDRSSSCPPRHAKPTTSHRHRQQHTTRSLLHRKDKDTS